MRKSFLTALGLLILLSIASCKTSKKITNPQREETTAQTTVPQNLTISREELEGTWIVKTAEKKAVVGESPVEITFDLTNGRIYGNDGCNVVNGTVILEGDNQLRFESLISTMKACRPEVTDRIVLNALNTSTIEIMHSAKKTIHITLSPLKSPLSFPISVPCYVQSALAAALNCSPRSSML